MPAGKALHGLDFTVEQEEFKLVIAQIRKEADGKRLKRDLIREIKGVLEPLRDEVREAILSAPTRGGLSFERDLDSMRQAIATNVVVQVRTGGKSTGAGLQGKRVKLRDFRDAPRRFNAPVFRHMVFGNRDVWVDQVGAPGWFDETVRKHSDQYKAAVMRAIEEMSIRIIRRS